MNPSYGDSTSSVHGRARVPDSGGGNDPDLNLEEPRYSGSRREPGEGTGAVGTASVSGRASVGRPAGSGRAGVGRASVSGRASVGGRADALPRPGGPGDDLDYPDYPDYPPAGGGPGGPGGPGGSGRGGRTGPRGKGSRRRTLILAAV